MADLAGREEADLIRTFVERFGEPPAIRCVELLKLILGEPAHAGEFPPQRV